MKDLDFGERPSWQTFAACRGQSHLMFLRNEVGKPGVDRVLDDAVRVAKAKLLCVSCPVLAQCRPTKPEDKHGVRAGVNYDPGPTRKQGGCTHDGCGRTVQASALCSTHYHRLRKGRDMSAPIAERGGNLFSVGPLFRLWCAGERRSGKEFGEMLGLNPRTFDRWYREGVSISKLDQIAVAVGVHLDEVELVEMLRSA